MMCSVVFFCRFAAKIWICKCFIIVRFYSITYITSIVKHDTLLFCFLLFLQTLPHTDRKRVKNHTQRKYCWQMKTQRDKLADILYIRVTDSKPETYKYIPRKARSDTIVIFFYAYLMCPVQDVCMFTGSWIKAGLPKGIRRHWQKQCRTRVYMEGFKNNQLKINTCGNACLFTAMCRSTSYDTMS